MPAFNLGKVIGIVVGLLLIAGLIFGAVNKISNQAAEIATVQGEKQTLADTNADLNTQIVQLKQDVVDRQKSNATITVNTAKSNDKFEALQSQLDVAISERVTAEQKVKDANAEAKRLAKVNGAPVPVDKAVPDTTVEVDIAWKAYCTAVPNSGDCSGSK